MLPFVVRLYFYRGSDNVRAVHSLVYDVDPTHTFIRGIGLRFSAPLDGELHERHVRFVGDNGGDCAGRGADLFESTAAENIGAMILGVGLYPVFGVAGILFPLVARALDLVAQADAGTLGPAPERADGRRSLGS